MRTVKILALRSSGHELDPVLNILRRFPCLEQLYVIVSTHLCLFQISDLIGILSSLVCNSFNISLLFPFAVSQTQ